MNDTTHNATGLGEAKLYWPSQLSRVGCNVWPLAATGRGRVREGIDVPPPAQSTESETNLEYWIERFPNHIKFNNNSRLDYSNVRCKAYRPHCHKTTEVFRYAVPGEETCSVMQRLYTCRLKYWPGHGLACPPPPPPPPVPPGLCQELANILTKGT